LKSRCSSWVWGDRDKAFDVLIDGIDLPGSPDLIFGGTGRWIDWASATTTVDLEAGTREINLEASSDGRGPNVDYLVVTPAPDADALIG